MSQKASADASPTSALRSAFFLQLPALFILLISFSYTVATPETLVYHPDTFFFVVFFTPAAFAIYNLSKAAYRGLPAFFKKRRSAAFEGSKAAQGAAGVTLRLKSVFTFIRRYGARAAIVLFILLLFAAGTLLIMKRQQTAETAADMAYFSLVIGVILKLFELKKDR